MGEPKKARRQNHSEDPPPATPQIKGHVRYYLSEEGRRASLRAGGDGRVLQAFDVVVAPEELDAFAVSVDGVVTLNLVDDYTIMEDHDFRLPEGKARWVGIAEAPVEQLQWDTVPTWEDLVATGREIKAMQERWAALDQQRADSRKETAEAFFNDGTARAQTIERDYVSIGNHRYRNTEAVAMEARTRFAADQEEIKRINRATLGEWIARHGTENQRQRLAAGLLPWKEAYESVENTLFKPLESFELYQRYDPRAICICERAGSAQCEVKFQSVDASELDAAEWELLAQIQAAAPAAEFRVREHRAQCVSRTEPEIRRAVVVKFALGNLTFKRQFVLTESEIPF